MSAAALLGGDGKILDQFIPATLSQAITGTATASIGASQTITFGGDLSGNVLVANGVYLFSASLLIESSGNIVSGIVDVRIDASGVTESGLGCTLNIPALNDAETFLSVTGTISSNADSSLSGVITLDATDYKQLLIRNPVLIRIL
jgi:hypothetical protein